MCLCVCVCGGRTKRINYVVAKKTCRHNYTKSPKRHRHSADHIFRSNGIIVCI